MRGRPLNYHRVDAQASQPSVPASRYQRLLAWRAWQAHGHQTKSAKRDMDLYSSLYRIPRNHASDIWVFPAKPQSTKTCLDWGMFSGYVSRHVSGCFEVCFVLTKGMLRDMYRGIIIPINPVVSIHFPLSQYNPNIYPI